MSSRSRSSSFNPEEDNLLKVGRAVQILDTLDSMDRRSHQMEMQEKQLLIDFERNELAKATFERQQNMDRLQIWQKGEAETAASYAAAEVPKINLDSPDGEKQLANWLSYAQAKGVSEDSVRSIFGSKMREKDVKTEFRAREQAEALGAEGLELYDSFRKTGMDPDKASRLAIKSEQAKSTLAYWQKFAEDKGTAFIPDMAKIKKRVGPSDSVTINENTFDATPYFYDTDALYSEISSKLSPELQALAKRETDKAGREAREQEATIGLKTSQGKEAEANAAKAAFEANVYKNLPSGTAAPARTPSPAANLFTY